MGVGGGIHKSVMATEATNVNWIKLTQDQPNVWLCVNDVDCINSITRQSQLGTHIDTFLCLHINCGMFVALNTPNGCLLIET